MKLRSASSYCIHLRSRHSLQHTALEHLQSMISFNVKDQASDPHKTTGKLTILRLYCAILFLYGKLGDEIFQIENSCKQFLHLFYSYLILPTDLVTFVPSYLGVSTFFFACSAINTYLRVTDSTVTNGQMNRYTANHKAHPDNLFRLISILIYTGCLFFSCLTDNCRPNPPTLPAFRRTPRVGEV